MPVYDLRCKTCNDIEERILGIEDEIPKCEKCGSKRERMCNCTHFELKYNSKTDMCSWGNEGYATTQRYRHVRKGNVDE